MNRRGDAGLTYGQVFVLLLAFCGASVLIFLLGMWVGRDLAERRLLREEPIVRVPVMPATPSPEEAPAEPVDRAFYERLKQKAEERLAQASPPQPPAVPTLAAPSVASPAARVVQSSPAARWESPRPTMRPPTPTLRPRPTPTLPVAARSRATEEWADAGWTVQVTATTDAAEARALVQRLRARGFDAYMVQAPTREGVTWYRVRVGRFQSRERAREMENRLRTEGGMPGAFITPQ